MRVDHHAYQRATRVALLGFGLQLLFGLILLLFGLLAPTGIEDGGRLLRGDTPTYFAALYVLFGLPVWLTLMVLFHQHQLEQLESLEQDEALAQGATIFEEDGTRVAGRRLRLMHQWLVPVLSLVLAGVLGLLAWRMLLRMGAAENDPRLFLLTTARGWAVAICLAGTLISFIFSRYVAGMAKQPAWQNLRGGAGYMVGNALVMLALGVGLAFRFFDNDSVIEAIAYAIPVLIILVGLEIVLNFILHLYRPRIPGEVPRPPFDSRILGLLAAPDSLVRSVNEAVNYQFGFDIASSWGYQLLLRSVMWLAGFGVLVMLGMSMITIVEPYQQAIRLRSGERVGEIHGSGMMFKWPWPFESSEVFDVGRVRTLPLTAVRRGRKDINLWTDELKNQTGQETEPFLVGISTIVDNPGLLSTGDDEAVSAEFSLLDAEVFLDYRIKPEPAEGLDKFLEFAPESVVRSRRMTVTELALRAMAVAELSRYFSEMTVDELLTTQRFEISDEVRSRIQVTFDEAETGIEIMSVTLPVLRPPHDLTSAFEDIAFAKQERIRRIDEANQRVETGLANMVGDLAVADRIYEEILAWERLSRRGSDDADAEAAKEKRLAIKEMLLGAGGEVALLIATSEKDRWVTQIDALTRVQSYQNEILPYRAAPEIYRQREIMRVLSRELAAKPKFILGIDPSRVDVDIDLKQSSSVFDFGRSVQEDGPGGGP